ncbi:uncharacterized protein IL334_006915 [Kwoniella shivajii]|uniref:BRCT domain-containing protein n=1 Tax=Kwoniella shivajii TaxID=564305 RepID=A0ABZ1D7A8_9TREE|nr:hypothetical protein IL334_006915 [Kwoniella shivajii]
MSSIDMTRAPQFTPIPPPPPPLTKTGTLIFKDVTFHILINEKEQELMDKDPPIDLYEPMKKFIVERAGGTIVSLQEADYILIRLQDIHQYAETIIQRELAQKVIHFQWVIDSLLSRERLDKEWYWGIPRSKSVAVMKGRKRNDTSTSRSADSDREGKNDKIHRWKDQVEKECIVARDPRRRPPSTFASSNSSPSRDVSQDPRKSLVTIEEKALDPRKRFSDSDFSSSMRRYPGTVTQVRALASYLGSASNAVRCVSERLPCPPSQSFKMSRLYRSISIGNGDGAGLRLNHDSRIFSGDIIWISGPTNVRKRHEPYIINQGGTIASTLKSATVLLFIRPNELPTCRELMRRAHANALYFDIEMLAEGWLHDCLTLERRIAQDPYKITPGALFDAEFWQKTSNGSMLKEWRNDRTLSNDISPLEEEKKAVRPLTPITATVVLKHEQRRMDTKNLVLAPSELVPETLSTPVSLLNNLSPRIARCMELDDEDLDVLCTDSESEATSATVPCSSPMDLDGHSHFEPSDVEDDKDDQTYQIKRRSKPGSKKRKHKKSSANDRSRKRTPSSYQSSVVQPQHQEKFDRVVRVLEEATKGHMIKGGIKATLRPLGLMHTYRKYASLVRQAVPNLPPAGFQPGHKSIFGTAKKA